MKGFIDKMLRILYPKRCILCDELLKYGVKAYLCSECSAVLNEYAAENPSTEYSELNRVYAAFRYENAMRDAIRRFKFSGQKENAVAFAEMIYVKEWTKTFYEDMVSADCIVPVPLHKKRLKERGFNQAEVLAKALSPKLGLQVRNALVRERITISMFGLTRTDRFTNVRGAFTVPEAHSVKGKKIILVDDIYTTGATAEECARTLKKAGAACVYLLALAIAGSENGEF